eukprot:5524385-Prymnesium_polylepis.2
MDLVLSPRSPFRFCFAASCSSNSGGGPSSTPSSNQGALLPSWRLSTRDHGFVARIAVQRCALLGPPWLPLHVPTGVESPLMSPNTSLLVRATMMPSPNTNPKKSVTAVDLRTPR